MSEHTYSRYDKNSFIIIGPKQKYTNIAKQVGGTWKKQGNGWVVKDINEPLFRKLIDILYPDNSFQFPNDGVIQVQKDVKVLRDTKTKRVFRRARSIGSSDDDSVEKVVPVIVHDPKQDINLYDYNEFILTSSGSDDDNDSSSSEDFPHPSPNRNKLANDDVLDKMERVRRRMFEMDMQERRTKTK